MDALTIATQVRVALQRTVRSPMFGVSVGLRPSSTSETTNYRVLLTFKPGTSPAVDVLRELEHDLQRWLIRRAVSASVEVCFRDSAAQPRFLWESTADRAEWPDTVQTIEL